MFENEAIAKDVLDRFLKINGQMNGAIRNAEGKVSPEEYKAFKRAVGYVMFEVFDKVVEPICNRYPSFRPPDMES